MILFSLTRAKKSIFMNTDEWTFIIIIAFRPECTELSPECVRGEISSVLTCLFFVLRLKERPSAGDVSFA